MQYKPKHIKLFEDFITNESQDLNREVQELENKLKNLTPENQIEFFKLIKDNAGDKLSIDSKEILDQIINTSLNEDEILASCISDSLTNAAFWFAIGAIGIRAVKSILSRFTENTDIDKD